MNEQSLRRAIKFATRSEVFQRISKGLRCTSFVIGVYQAAMLKPIVRKAMCKFPFKELNSMPLEQVLNAMLIDGWRNTDLGTKVVTAFVLNKYNDLFTDALDLDLKYSIPRDLFIKLEKSEQWQEVGYFFVFNKKLVRSQKYATTLDDSPTRMQTPPLTFSPTFTRSAPCSPTETATHTDELSLEQLEFLDQAAKSVKQHATPPRSGEPGSPRDLGSASFHVGSPVQRRLFSS